MTTLAESLVEPTSSPIHDALTAGEEVLSQEQVVEFTPYVRVVLPVDGFVFWLNASLLTPAQLAQHSLQSPLPVCIQGSLHYASIAHQDPDQTMVVRQVDFTVPEPVDAFGALAADVMYIGVYNTPLGPFRFTFSQRNSFYLASKIWHYVGDAVYPAFDNLLIDDPAGFDQRRVVSNSLPIWMSMFANPPFPSPITINPPIYPAMLVPQNLVPPYVAVEIDERPYLLQVIPRRQRNSSSDQLCCDRVRLTSYGLRNDQVMDLRDYILDYSETTDLIGIVEPPVVMDMRRPQVELAALAVKKQIELTVSYYQLRARGVARQLIQSAVITFTPALLVP